MCVCEGGRERERDIYILFTESSNFLHCVVCKKTCFIYLSINPNPKQNFCVSQSSFLPIHEVPLHYSITSVFHVCFPYLVIHPFIFIPSLIVIGSFFSGPLHTLAAFWIPRLTSPTPSPPSSVRSLPCSQATATRHRSPSLPTTSSASRPTPTTSWTTTW